MSAVYSWLARRMTDFENHETQNGYESSLTLKLAIFQSINSYFSLVYIVSRFAAIVDDQAHDCIGAGWSSWRSQSQLRLSPCLTPLKPISPCALSNACLDTCSSADVLICSSSHLLICSCAHVQAAIKNVIVINGQQQHCTVNSRTGEPDCLGELQSQLATLIILKVLMGLFFQFLMPLIFRCLRRAYMRCWYRKTPAAQQLYDSWRKARKVSPLERDASRPPYDPFDGAFDAHIYAHVHAYVHMSGLLVSLVTRHL